MANCDEYLALLEGGDGEGAGDSELSGKSLDELLRMLGAVDIKKRDAAQREVTKRLLKDWSLRATILEWCRNSDREVRFRSLAILLRLMKDIDAKRNAQIERLTQEEKDLAEEVKDHDSVGNDHSNAAREHERAADNLEKAGNADGAKKEREAAAEESKKAAREFERSAATDRDRAQARKDKREQEHLKKKTDDTRKEADPEGGAEKACEQHTVSRGSQRGHLQRGHRSHVGPVPLHRVLPAGAAEIRWRIQKWRHDQGGDLELAVRLPHHRDVLPPAGDAGGECELDLLAGPGTPSVPPGHFQCASLAVKPPRSLPPDPPRTAVRRHAPKDNEAFARQVKAS
jgi:hypothetical protein